MALSGWLQTTVVVQTVSADKHHHQTRIVKVDAPVIRCPQQYAVEPNPINWQILILLSKAQRKAIQGSSHQM
jgi:hypothetical protein